MKKSPKQKDMSDDIKRLQRRMTGGGAGRAKNDPHFFTFATSIPQAWLLPLLRPADVASRAYRWAWDCCPCGQQRSRPRHVACGTELNVHKVNMAAQCSPAGVNLAVFRLETQWKGLN